MPVAEVVPASVTPLAAREFVPSAIDAAVAPDGVAAWAARRAPGGELVGALAGVQADRLSEAGRVDALRAWDRVAAWAAARQQELLSLMAADSGADGPQELERSWENLAVAGALRISSRGATYRLAVARELDRLPLTRAALEAGRSPGTMPASWPSSCWRARTIRPPRSRPS